MKNLIFLFLFLCVSCNSNLDVNNGMENGEFEQLWDSDVELYPFVPFTDEEMKTLPYDVKLEKRQIPEDYLSGMTTKSLFYQYVYCELSGGMYLFNSSQAGFIAMKKQLNMLPELLNRPDAGKGLIRLLEKTDLSKLNNTESFHFYFCLERILAQPEVIDNMTNDDVDAFIQMAMRTQETIVNLSKTNKDWSNSESLAALMFGLGNVMLKYEYEPFILLMDSEPSVKDLMQGGNLRVQECVLLMNGCIKDFIEFKK